ncbi:MAG: rRNA maturation RNase YbeY [Elusimicrobiales bacterium]
MGKSEKITGRAKRVGVFYEAAVPRGSRPPQAILKKAVSRALGKTGGAVCVIFVDGTRIRRLNRRWLKKNRLTDVIAFSYPAAPGAPLGDIFVCAEQAARQAARLGHSLKKELLILAAHGALHLAGMDDDTAARRADMNAAALKILEDL